MVTVHLPAGWPDGVHPPGSERFEQTAVAWLLDVVPPDYRVYGVLQRHPVALAALARHHLAACVAGARDGYRTARAELGGQLPPGGIDAILAAYRSEGGRLVATAQAVELIERAFRGESFPPQLGGTQDASRTVNGRGATDRPRSARTDSARTDSGHSGPGHSGPGHSGPGHSGPGHSGSPHSSSGRPSSGTDAGRPSSGTDAGRPSSGTDAGRSTSVPGAGRSSSAPGAGRSSPGAGRSASGRSGSGRRTPSQPVPG
jgi:hypothetical protein